MFGTATERQQDRKWRDAKDGRKPGCKRLIDQRNGRALLSKHRGQVEFGIANRLAPRQRQSVKLEMTGAINSSNEIRRLRRGRERPAKLGVVQAVAMRDQYRLVLFTRRSRRRESCNSMAAMRV